MIIQCKQCRTKFRFDDTFMQGSGVWLRCSRCGHVYFQENTHINKTELNSLSEPEPAAIEEEIIPVEESVKSPDETPSVFHRDEHGIKSLDKIMAARKRFSEEIDSDVEKTQEKSLGMETPEPAIIEKPAKPAKIEKNEEPEIIEKPAKPAKIEKNEEPEIIEKPAKPEKKKISSRKGSGKAWKIALWSVLVIVIIPGVIYFYALPQFGDQLINSSDYLIKKFDEYRGVSEPVKSGGVINQMVKLQDVRYRRINNYILGQIGVLEGTAVNRADYPLSRIQVKGEIVDAYSVVLGERPSYAGNILTDEELTNLPEEEILLKLHRPEGLNNSNDKIMPNGQIPFMIVFPNEPAGVIKTTVMTIGAERLL
jgi:predicted Zn finger-like uncharacterized protein